MHRADNLNLPSSYNVPYMARAEVVYVVAAALYVDGTVLFVQRPRTAAHYPGCYEIPGGKVEAGERPYDALRRELKEEVDLELATTKSPAFHTELDIDGVTLRFTVYELTKSDWTGQVRRMEAQPDMKWLPVSSGGGRLALTPGTRAWWEWKSRAGETVGAFTG
mgnify:CR=1 FL=1